VISIILMLLPVAVWRGQANPAEVSGTVSTFDYGTPARVRDARLEFQKLSEAKITVMTNKIGKYSAFLDPDSDYTIKVTAEGFCPVHRPRFPTSPNSSVKFDFILTTNCPRDIFAVDPDANFFSPLPVYFEENISLGKKGLIVAFGRREKVDSVVKYGPLPVREHPGVQIPVTISILTHTVRADRAVFDQDTGTMRAEGNVSIADGSPSEPRVVPCVVVRLGDAEPQIRPCKPGD